MAVIAFLAIENPLNSLSVHAKIQKILRRTLLAESTIKKKNRHSTFYVSSKTKYFLNRLQGGRPETSPAESKTVKMAYYLSEESDILLEHLQRKSKDQNKKKSKGWFIDQALEDYVSDGGETLIRRFEKERSEKMPYKSKGWFVEKALQKKYVFDSEEKP